MSGSAEQQIQAALEVIKGGVTSGKITPESAKNLERWLTKPYYVAFRPDVLKLAMNADFTALNNLFWERIPFGTGGRRGPMSQFGSATINSRTIAESAHGLAVYVQRAAKPDQLGPDEKRYLKAVVARDTRHRSTEFARLTASILAAHGFRVYFFPDPRATPELSFAVRYLKCDAGVMISASHNPPTDNGFKAYWKTGGQVLSPHDAGIIECVDATEEIPNLDFDLAVSEGKIVLLNQSPDVPSVDQAYLDAVCQLSLSNARDIQALYTPMHGVGESSVGQVIRRAEFRRVDVYEPQRSQDGSFPNVPDHLPNPERPQALRPAIEFAKSNGHSLVLASDPDADRLAVAVRNSDDDFVCLTGNQLGALITNYVLSKRQAAGTLTSEHFVVETLVTTPMMAVIAKRYGVKAIRELLVGFKYIAAAIDEHGPDKFLFAAEESVGYLAGQYCRDKDACVAALYALELASELKARGLTLLDELEQLYTAYGYYHETQFVQTCPGATGSEQIARMMKALRTNTPDRLGSVIFDIVRDYQRHEIRSLPSNSIIDPLPSPKGDLLIMEGQVGHCQVTLAGRPSGTEPKIKFYLFANASPEIPLDQAKSETQHYLSELQQSLKNWLEENG